MNDRTAARERGADLLRRFRERRRSSSSTTPTMSPPATHHANLTGTAIGPETRESYVSPNPTLRKPSSHQPPSPKIMTTEVLTNPDTLSSSVGSFLLVDPPQEQRSASPAERSSLSQEIPHNRASSEIAKIQDNSNKPMSTASLTTPQRSHNMFSSESRNTSDAQAYEGNNQRQVQQSPSQSPIDSLVEQIREEERAKAKQEYSNHQMGWRQREARLLQMITEGETNKRTLQQQVADMKTQAILSEQKMSSEVESLSRQLREARRLLEVHRNQDQSLAGEKAKFETLIESLRAENECINKKNIDLLETNEELRVWKDGMLAAQSRGASRLPSNLVESTFAGESTEVELEQIEAIQRAIQGFLKEGINPKEIRDKLSFCVSNARSIALSGKTTPTSEHLNSSSNLTIALARSINVNPELTKKPAANEQQMRIDKLEQVNTKLKIQISQLVATRSQLINRNNALVRKINQIAEEKQVALDALKQNMNQLLLENQRVTNDYVTQSKKAEGWKESSQKCRIDVEEVEVQLESVNTALQTKTASLDVANEELAGLRKELTTVRTQLDETRDHCEVLKQSKDVLAKRCLSLERIIEGIKINSLRNSSSQLAESENDASQGPLTNELITLEDRCKALLKEKFALQKQCDEHDGKLHSLQEHIFDLETDLRARDLEIELMSKRSKEKELQLKREQEKAKKVSEKIKAEVRKSLKRPVESPGWDLDEFGLRRVDQDFITNLLMALFPSFFHDEGLRSI